MTRISLLALLIAAAALAGCTVDEDPAGDGTDDPSQTPPIPTKPNPPEVPLTIDLPERVTTPENGAVTVHGEVNREATVSGKLLDGNESTNLDPVDTNGSFSFTFDAPYGQSILRVTADDGNVQTVTDNVDLLRLANGTHAVVFRGDVPQKEDREDTFQVDIDTLYAAPEYDPCDGFERPDFFTVHDAMVAWSGQAGVPFTTGDCTQFGFLVETIDGHDSPGGWCYTKNGSSDVLGMSSEPYAPGDTVTWDDCAVVFG